MSLREACPLAFLWVSDTAILAPYSHFASPAPHFPSPSSLCLTAEIAPYKRVLRDSPRECFAIVTAFLVMSDFGFFPFTAGGFILLTFCFISLVFDLQKQ